MDYTRSEQGWNVSLKSREPIKYIITVLEVARSSGGPEELHALENAGKKLSSKELASTTEFLCRRWMLCAASLK
jgi:hypothetical protein